MELMVLLLIVRKIVMWTKKKDTYRCLWVTYC